MGTASHIPKKNNQPAKDIFTVEKLAIYVRDTYDFRTTSNFELLIPLGIWNKDRQLSKSEMVLYALTASRAYDDFVSIYNIDFDAWQDRLNEGGDFVAYSDVKWSIPSTPLIIDIPK